MKKTILIILTTIVSLFIFNFNVEALNSDATATCVYKLPPAGASSSGVGDYYTSATLKFSNGDQVSGTCDKVSTYGSLTSISSTIKDTCNIEVTSVYFTDSKTGNVICPNLYYYEAYKIGFLSGGNYTFKILDEQAYQRLENSEIKKATVLMEMKPSSSKTNQGTTAATEKEENDYRSCRCGTIILKTSGAYFTDKNEKWNSKRPTTTTPSFDLANMKECPSSISYLVSTKSIKVSNYKFDGATEVACADTLDLKTELDSKKNDTNFIEQLDVILPFCDETSRMWKIFGYLINALKILVPALIIVMGSIDLGKAVVAQNEDEMKKSTQVLVKRIIAGIIIFFIPTIVSLIFNIVSRYSVYFNNGSGCISCITKPWGC